MIAYAASEQGLELTMQSYKEEERLAELQAVRQEMGELNRDEGVRLRPAATSLALVLVVWLIVLLFDLVGGRSFTAATAIMLAAFTGLCWGMYREKHERSFGIYALAAAAAMLCFVLAHFLGA